IASRRGLRTDSGVTDRIVNQLLTEMDGITLMKGVMVLAATNRPDILDTALLRPGRFDKVIYIPPPDEKARYEIFKVHTRNMPLSEDVDLERLAKNTKGYTGADIAAVCREAAMNALREALKEPGKPLEEIKVHMRHFEEALRKVGASISESDIRFYEEIGKRFKKLLG
ncbi:MAG: AAA family ATPase, partial [Thermoprotei archaeon]